VLGTWIVDVRGAGVLEAALTAAVVEVAEAEVAVGLTVGLLIPGVAVAVPVAVTTVVGVDVA